MKVTSRCKGLGCSNSKLPWLV